MGLGQDKCELPVLYVDQGFIVIRGVYRLPDKCFVFKLIVGKKTVFKKRTLGFLDINYYPN